ncbi:MAG: outer membrane protein assembly factor BamE [Pseudomonadales bacterium]|jgi:outer membrane protein assembly factor BamE|nr:outer membrane protein assembly factor BamE [Pseudomonadales bacterium]
MTHAGGASYHPRRSTIADRTEPPPPMMRTAGTLLALLLIANTSACSSIDLPELRFPGVYRATIQQGNVVTQEMVDRLRPGMTRRQVRFVLGEPVVANAFRADRWDYLYTIQIGAQERQQQRLTLYFDDDELSYFEGDFVPTAVKEAREAAEAAAAEAAAQG